MRTTWLMLALAAGLTAALASAQDDAPNPDEKLLQAANLKTDGPALLEFFRKRTLPEAQQETIRGLIRQLGADNYRVREQAAAALVERGPVVTEILKAALKDNDLETMRRIEKSLREIKERDVAPEVPAAAARLLGVRKPAGTVDVLLAYLPFADNDAVIDEARGVLAKVAVEKGKADAKLVAALTDKEPIRRAAAAEALTRAAFADHKDAIRKLLSDPDAAVRFRVSQALVYAKERDALPTLIQTLPDLPLSLAWQAEDFLLRLGEAHTPPAVPLGNDRAARAACRDAWLAWWKDQGPKVDLAHLEAAPKLQGKTLLVLLDQGRVMEVGPANQELWHVDGLVFPLDAQLLGDDRLLVAEYHADRVTERSIKNPTKELWRHDVRGPLVAQRLPSGNTFIATDMSLLEVDKEGKEVLNVAMPDESKRIMKAMKLPNGEIACLVSDARVLRLDAKGKEIASFQVDLGMRLFGGRIHMLPSGRVLVPHHAEGKVVEYDGKGKPVWEVAFDKPVAATRLPNGHTLITSMNATTGAVEVDRAGRQVWSYRTTTRVTRALRR